jgi:hypothetical protein
MPIVMKKFIELSSADENNADVSVLVNVEKITYLRELTEDQNGLQTVIFFGDEHPVLFLKESMKLQI